MIVQNIVKNVSNSINSYKQQLSAIKRFRLKLILTFVNAFLLLFFTVAMQYTSLTRSDEISFLGWASAFKHNVLGMDPKPDEENIVFLDVSKDIVTIDDPDFTYSGTDSIAGAKVVIKDRKKLAVLLNELNKNPNDYKYVLCDILFDYDSPDDAILKPIIEKTKNFTSTSVFEKNKFIKPIFEVSSGCVNYSLINNTKFVKIPLYTNDIKSLPLVVYETRTGKKTEQSEYLTYFDNQIAFNTIIPEMYYRSSDLRRVNQGSKNANFFYLGDVVTKRNFFNDYLKGKFIIIGDFQNDNHSTFAGSIPGCMVLFNTYLTLENHLPIFSFTWMFVLFIIYFLLSYFMFIHPENKLEGWKDKINIPFFKKIILKYISYIGILIVIDIISYLFYRTFISIFYIATYLTFLEMTIDNYKKVMKKIKHYGNKIRMSFFWIAILTVLTSTNSFCQNVYSVSAQKGKIYYNNKLLKVGDQLAHIDKLTAESRDCKVRLLNPQKGSCLITFLNGTVTFNEQIKKKSELYQIVVQKYIDSYNATRVLTTRGEFDWVDFFADSSNVKMALFEGQKIPLLGNKISVDSTSKFVATIYKEKDSSSINIKTLNGKLVFDINLFPKGDFVWKLKMVSNNSNTDNSVVITPNPIYSSFITNAELKSIVELFAVTDKENYVDVKAAKKEIYHYLQFNYGTFYKPYVDPIINGYFKANN